MSELDGKFAIESKECFVLTDWENIHVRWHINLSISLNPGLKQSDSAAKTRKAGQLVTSQRC